MRVVRRSKELGKGPGMSLTRENSEPDVLLSVARDDRRPLRKVAHRRRRGFFDTVVVVTSVRRFRQRKVACSA